MKYHVFFRRVSTENQNMEMQQSADAPYREKLLPEEIIIIDEDAVSANKKLIDERPEMQKLISLIEQNKVDTLYVFDRSRLFRNFYEGLKFSVSCKKHNLQILYTSQGNGNAQATQDIFFEGVLYMVNDIEGKNIGRRTAEANRRYPGRKLGFLNENKQYHIDPAKKEILISYFSSLDAIETVDDLAVLLSQYRKKINRNDETLIRIACDPFYAGYDLYKGENKLAHVEAYITLENYRFIQDSLGELFVKYMERIQKLDSQRYYSPTCGYCNKPLIYQRDKIKNSSYYKCQTKNRNHPQVFLPTADLVNLLNQVFKQIIHHLDSSKLLKHSQAQFRDICKKINAQKESIDYRLNELEESIALGDAPYTTDWKENPEYRKLNNLKQEKQKLLDEISLNEGYVKENKTIVQTVKDTLCNRSEMNPLLLYKMFINQIYVVDSVVKFDLFMFDYLDELPKEQIYVGDDNS